MIKAVIFDFGSVLVRGGEWKIIYKQIAKALKIPLQKIRKISRPLREKWSKNTINEKKFWQELEKRAGKKLPPKFKKNLWYRPYKERTKDMKESWKILKELKKRRFRLALLSNIIPPTVKANKDVGRFKRLKKIGFETLVLSCEVGCRKPEPKIYKIVLKRLNLPVKECLFIDDVLDNIKAAKKMGMRGIHFKTSKQLRKELIKLGLL